MEDPHGTQLLLTHNTQLKMVLVMSPGEHTTSTAVVKRKTIS